MMRQFLVRSLVCAVGLGASLGLVGCGGGSGAGSSDDIMLPMLLLDAGEVAGPRRQVGAADFAANSGDLSQHPVWSSALYGSNAPRSIEVYGYGDRVNNMRRRSYESTSVRGVRAVREHLVREDGAPQIRYLARATDGSIRMLRFVPNALNYNPSNPARGTYYDPPNPTLWLPASLPGNLRFKRVDVAYFHDSYRYVEYDAQVRQEHTASGGGVAECIQLRLERRDSLPLPSPRTIDEYWARGWGLVEEDYDPAEPARRGFRVGGGRGQAMLNNPAGVLTEPAGATANVYFGYNVAISGDRMVIAAPRFSDAGSVEDDNLGNIGAVYEYERVNGAWGSQFRSITARRPDPGVAVGVFSATTVEDHRRNDQFGAGLALFGDTLAMGAPGRDDLAGNDSEVGTLYIARELGTPDPTLDWQWGRIVSPNPEENDRFGGSSTTFEDQDFGQNIVITASSKTDANAERSMIIGVPNRDAAAGAVYFWGYDPNLNDGEWLPVQYLDPSNADNADDPFNGDPLEDPLDNTTEGLRFGWSVAALDNEQGRTVFVGIPGNGTTHGGSVAIYRRNTTDSTDPGDWEWEIQQHLAPADGRAGDEFGYSISVRGNYLVVGAPGVSDLGVNTGAAYVFQFNSVTRQYVQTVKLTAWDHQNRGQDQDAFGRSVAMHPDEDMIAVGAPRRPHAGENQVGSVYVFQRAGDLGSSWDNHALVRPSNANRGDFIGRQVLWDEGADSLVIPVPRRDVSGEMEAGAVYFTVVRPAGDG